MATRRKAPGAAGKNLRLVIALVGVIGSAGCILSSRLTWLALPAGSGLSTYVSGWGVISGGSQIAGQNINDAANGNATFRPGLLAVIVGVIALLAAIAMALAARGPKPHRIPASVLTLGGVAGLAWGIVRISSPNSLDLPDDAGFSSGAGPWLLAGSSVVLLAIAVVVFIGLLDPPAPIGRRGIGPR